MATQETALATVNNSAAVVQFAEKPVEIQQFEFQQRAARLFSSSGLFADIKGQTQEQAMAQAFVKIALGQSMGFTPAEAMTGIDIIQGRVAVGASLRAARMQRAGYSWRIKRLDDTGCELDVYFANDLLGSVGYTKTEAERAGLASKDNYRKNPSDMYFARAITRAQRRFAPGVLGVDILSSEEAVDVTEPQPTAATATQRKADELRQRLTAAQPEPEHVDIEVVEHTPVGEQGDGTFCAGTNLFPNGEHPDELPRKRK